MFSIAFIFWVIDNKVNRIPGGTQTSGYIPGGFVREMAFACKIGILGERKFYQVIESLGYKFKCQVSA